MNKTLYTRLLMCLVLLLGAANMWAQSACTQPVVRIVTNAKSTNAQPFDDYGMVISDFLSDGSNGYWLWETGATFTENPDGTARLQGTIAQFGNAARKMTVDVSFSDLTFVPRAGSPYVSYGQPATDWYYYRWGTAILRGAAGTDLAGAEVHLNGRGPDFQFGTGADNQPEPLDLQAFGGSGWFDYTVISQPSNGTLTVLPFTAFFADFNFLLSGTPATPCVVCDNVTSAGSIGSNQTICAGSVPAPITSLEPASGGSGTLEYIWLQSTTGCPNSLSQTIPNATGETYSPSALSVTTYFRRCARRAGCTDFIGESNCITITVQDTTPPTLTCPADVNLTTLTDCANFVLPTPTVSDNCSTPSVTSSVGTIGQNFCFPIGDTTVTYTARDEAGNTVACTFVVTVVRGCDNVTSGGTIGRDQTICAGTAAATLTSVTPATGGTGDIEYLWLSSTTGCPNALSQAISGATNATYEPGILTQTTYFRRCARRAGCTDYVGESNCVTVTVADNTPPTITCPTNVSLTTSSTCANFTLPTATTSDNCSDTVTVTSSVGTIGQNHCFPIGTTTVTYTARDEAGNTATCSYTVTVTQIIVCDNVTSAGTIGKSCNNGVTTLTNVTSPSGGTGTLEYMWLRSTTGCPTSASQAIAGATSATYTIAAGTITTTTYFVRCVRRAGCTSWAAESNCITVTPTECVPCNNLTSGGTIGKSCNNGIVTLTNVTSPSGGSGTIEYMWLKSTTGCPTLATQVIAGATGETYVAGNITVTTYFRRCSRRAGCQNWVGESNCIVVYPTECVACNNVTEGGTIGKSCNNGITTLTSVTAPTGGSGTIEYMWLKSTTGCPTSATQAITGATSATYVAGNITVTTYFRRCSRRAGCTNWVGESNCITVTPTECVPCNNLTSGGTIGKSCVNGSITITNVTSPSGGAGTIEYMWLRSTTSCPTSASQAIAGATGATYTVGSVSVTTYFRRCSRRAGCQNWVGESNCITVTPTECPTCSNLTSGGTIGKSCNNGIFTLTNVTTPTGGSGTIEYMWLRSTSGCPTSASQAVVGATGATLTVGSITTTTYFRRCARRAGCSAWVGESNCITVTPNDCPTCNNVTSGGTIAKVCNNGIITLTNSVLPSGGAGTIEYVWVKSTTGCPTSTSQIVGNNCNTSNLVVGAVTVTTYFRRYARRVGCSAWVGESNCITVMPNECVPCSNLTSGGTIAKSCVNGVITLTNATSPTGGSGTIEYMWLRSTLGCPTALTQAIVGANAETYTIPTGSVTVTTYFRRCARRAGCTVWQGESNCITVQPNECPIYPTFDPTKCYRIVSRASGKAMEVAGGQTHDGANIQQWDYLNLAHQQWKVVGLGNGEFRLVAQHSGKVADVSASSLLDGANVQQWTNNGTNTQIWRIETLTGGFFKLTCKNSGKVLDVSGFSTSNGANIHQWAWHGGNNQQWQIVEVPCASVCSNVTEGGTIAKSCNNGVITLTSTVAASGGSGILEYMWLRSTSGCPNSVTQAIAGATGATYTVGSVTVTTYFRRCARRAGCQDWVGESNCITVQPNECVPCNNVTSGGTIGKSCNNGIITLTNTAAASGGAGTLEYMWLRSTTGCPTLASQAIAGATNEIYTVGSVTTTTYFRRCARRAGCQDWVGESNCITVQPNECTVHPTFDPTKCYRIVSKSTGKAMEVAGGQTHDGANIQQWDYLGLAHQQWKVVGLGNGEFRLVAQHSGKVADVAWSSLADGGNVHQWSNNGTNAQIWKIETLAGGFFKLTCKNSGKVLDVYGGFTANGTNLIQWAWHGGDNQQWQIVEVPCATVCNNVTAGGTIGVTCSNNQVLLTSVSPASGGLGTLEYMWLRSTSGCPSSLSQAVPNSNAETFNVGSVTVTTYFRRCARRAGCLDWVGESNCITVTPTQCNVTTDCKLYDALSTATNCGSGTPYAMYLNINGGANYYAAERLFFERNGTTATIKGTLRAANGAVVEVNVTYTGGTMTAPVGSPKFELCLPSTASTTGWTYFTGLTGTVAMNGQTFNISRRGPAFQMGMGANLQDVSRFGASGWFTLSNGIEGDFNLRLMNERACVTNPYCVGGRNNVGVVALYNFREATGNIVYDRSNFGTPLNLTIAHTANTQWITNGLRINNGTIIKSATTAAKIATACQQTNAITMEAWVKPANTTQAGPARIATYSENTIARNFTLAQEGDDYIARLKTTVTDANGMPQVNAANVLTTALQHVVYTRDALGNERVYVNGVLRQSSLRQGNFSNWGTHCHFAIGNEMTLDRAWRGDLHLVAVFNRALSATEVTQNFNAGICSSSQSFNATAATPIIRLDGAAEPNRNRLEWLNNTGYKNDYFAIQRLNNVGEFETIDVMNTDGLNPNDEIHQYSIYDNRPFEGDNHYRIKAVFYDGTFRLSDVKTISNTPANEVKVFPNPAETFVRVSLKEYEGKAVTMYIYNQFGAVVKTIEVDRVGSGSVELDLNELNSGQFTLRVVSEGRRDVIRQFQMMR